MASKRGGDLDQFELGVHTVDPPHGQGRCGTTTTTVCHRRRATTIASSWSSSAALPRPRTTRRSPSIVAGWVHLPERGQYDTAGQSPLEPQYEGQDMVQGRGRRRLGTLE